jgi:hypothetical protein
MTSFVLAARRAARPSQQIHFMRGILMGTLLIVEDEIAVRDALTELVGKDGVGDCNGK